MTYYYFSIQMSFTYENVTILLREFLLHFEDP